MVLSFAELPDDRQPPEEIWLDDEGLAAHFESIRLRNRDESSNYEVIPDMEQNELLKGLRI